MIRQVVTTNYGEDRIRHEVRISHGVESPEEGQESFAALMRFMQDVCYSPDLVRHVGASPESVRFYHDAGNWVMEAVTIVPREG